MPTTNGVGRIGIRQRPPQYLLDGYPGAALAFSMRRLNSAYNGPVIRIRRASDNAEMDINFTASSEVVATNTTSTNYMSGQLKDSVSESEIINFCGTSNGYIVRIYDQSGNGNHLNQTTAANQTALYYNGGDGWYNRGLWSRKQTYGGSSGKLPFSGGTYNLSSGVQTNDNWTAFSITAGTGFTSRLSAGSSNSYTLMTTYAFFDGGLRAGSKNKYVMSTGGYNGGPNDPFILSHYGKSCLYTTTNSNNNMGIRLNNTNINLPYVQSSINTGIFDQITPGAMFELILFNTDKSSVNPDIENTILSYYSTTWTTFKG